MPTTEIDTPDILFKPEEERRVIKSVLRMLGGRAIQRAAINEVDTAQGTDDDDTQEASDMADM